MAQATLLRQLSLLLLLATGLASAAHAGVLCSDPSPGLANTLIEFTPQGGTSTAGNTCNGFRCYKPTSRTAAASLSTTTRAASSPVSRKLARTASPP